MKDFTFERNQLLAGKKLRIAEEEVKFRSRYLRGTIKPGLRDSITGAVTIKDAMLLKFHGIYQQDDREQRADRKRRKLEPAYQFMVRLRLPAGRCTTTQWSGLNRISKQFSNRGLRITTRQTVQLHGVKKTDLPACIQALKALGIDTLAACGDDTRGIVCGANARYYAIQKQIEEIAKKTSQLLVPKTSGYEEIWFDQPPGDNDIEEEPFYGSLYLPRKFKIGFCIPPINDVDIFAQDLGFIAIIEAQQLVGFNICVGGGMGQLDNRTDSYPRMAQLVGFIEPEDVYDLAAIIISIQRDFGDRTDRHRARFKYTLDTFGIEWFLDKLEQRRNKALLSAKPFEFTKNIDAFGWEYTSQGTWNLTLHVASGRLDGALQERLQAFTQRVTANVKLSPNQNFSITDILDQEKPEVETLLTEFQLWDLTTPDIQAAHSLSCVALPTCGLAMAEAERYMPDFLQKFNALKAKHGIAHIPITLRITGCPNGCARPYLAEIALTGRGPGLYNLYAGGSYAGERLNFLIAENLREAQVISQLNLLFASYSRECLATESFGDYITRIHIIPSHGSGEK